MALGKGRQKCWKKPDWKDRHHGNAPLWVFQRWPDGDYDDHQISNVDSDKASILTFLTSQISMIIIKSLVDLNGGIFWCFNHSRPHSVLFLNRTQRKMWISQPSRRGFNHNGHVGNVQISGNALSRDHKRNRGVSRRNVWIVWMFQSNVHLW